MILYLPYGTDAPLYYRPIMTIIMIAVNVLLFISYTPGELLFTGGIPVAVEPYLLTIGDGLHPLQWLTNNFFHEGLFHLLGNMLFLWIFGMIVEGKLGPVKMLAVYLGIGIFYGATVQILLLGHTPTFCLGASAIIFGLAAMCVIWAPENEIDGILIVFLVFFRHKYLETKISVLVTIFLLLQAVPLYFFRDKLSSELLHLVGAVIGLLLGIIMLRMKLVDCEYWDIFSVWAGTNLLTDEERADMEANKPEAIKQRQEARQKRQNLLGEEIELALQNQTPMPAFVIAQRTEREFPDWILPHDLHIKMIQQLLGGKHWTEATTSMRQYLERHQEQSVFVSMMLAQALLAQNKPKAALKVFDNVSLEVPEQQSAIFKIRAKAESMHQKNLDEGFYELDEM